MLLKFQSQSRSPPTGPKPSGSPSLGSLRSNLSQLWRSASTPTLTTLRRLRRAASREQQPPKVLGNCLSPEAKAALQQAAPSRSSPTPLTRAGPPVSTVELTTSTTMTDPLESLVAQSAPTSPPVCSWKRKIPRQRASAAAAPTPASNLAMQKHNSPLADALPQSRSCKGASATHPPPPHPPPLKVS